MKGGGGKRRRGDTGAEGRGGEGRAGACLQPLLLRILRRGPGSRGRALVPCSDQDHPLQALLAWLGS